MGAVECGALLLDTKSIIQDILVEKAGKIGIKTELLSEDEKYQALFNKLVSKSQESGVTKYDIIQFVSDLMVMSKKNQEGLVNKYLEDVSYRKSIRKTVSEQFLSRSLEESLQELGYFQELSSTKDLMSKFWFYKKKIVVGSLDGALNAFVFILTGQITYIPQVSILNRKNLSESLYKLIDERGFDAAYPEIKKEYGRYARFNQAWEISRRTFNIVMLAALLQFAHENQQWIKFSFQHVVSKIVSSEPNMQAAAARQSLFESWKSSIIDLEGRQPTATEISEKWREINKLPDSFFSSPS
jgi:hypothetical protein